MVAGAVLTTAAGVAIAKQITVQPRAVEVVAEMSTDSDTVEVVQPNQRLEVLGESGPWLKVKTASGKTGYVPAAIVSRKSGGMSAAHLTGGPDATQMGASTAGKGLTQDAGSYAQSHGYRSDGPDRIAAMRTKYKPDLKSFEQEGQVGKSH
jgi:hypothetical protein